MQRQRGERVCVCVADKEVKRHRNSREKERFALAWGERVIACQVTVLGSCHSGLACGQQLHSGGRVPTEPAPGGSTIRHGSLSRRRHQTNLAAAFWKLSIEHFSAAPSQWSSTDPSGRDAAGTASVLQTAADTWTAPFSLGRNQARELSGGRHGEICVPTLITQCLAAIAWQKEEEPAWISKSTLAILSLSCQV